MYTIQNCRHGTLLLNANDPIVGRSLALYGEYLEGSTSLFKEILNPGDVAVDVGANIGCLTIPIAKFVTHTGKVLAFEPQRLLYYALCANTITNGLDQIVCLQNAVGATTGRIEVPELRINQSHGFGGVNLRKPSHEHPYKVSVKLAKLDDFKLQNVQLLKISAESMEQEVILGADETIARCRPHLYIDASDHENTFTLIRLLEKLNYDLFLHAPPFYNGESNFMRQPENVFGNLSAIRIFAVPTESPATVDTDKHGLQKITNQNKIVVAPNVDSTHDVVSKTRLSVVEGLFKLADAKAEIEFDAEAAMVYAEQAIEMADDLVTSSMLLRPCSILTRHRRYEDALSWANRACAFDTNPTAIYTKAIILGALDRPFEAIDCYREVCKIAPDNAEVNFNLSHDLLKAGHYKEGWELYEWRFQRRTPTLREFMRNLSDKPTWDGSPLRGRRILLYMEQGIGDFIMMIRYARLVHAAGGHVLVAAFPELIDIIKNVEGVSEVVEVTPELKLAGNPQYDFTCSLMSLPKVLSRPEPYAPSDIRYINPYHTGAFDDIDFSPERLNIGIAWCGSETHLNDFTRSMHLKHLKPIFDLPIIGKVFSLQKGPQSRKWPCGVVDLVEGASDMNLIDITNRFTNLHATAEFIDMLDVVVTVDTSIAHLAGALGKKVYLLIWKNSDWRWGLGDSTPWYPTLEIIRGETWDKVIDNACGAINHLPPG